MANLVEMALRMSVPESAEVFYALQSMLQQRRSEDRDRREQEDERLPEGQKVERSAESKVTKDAKVPKHVGSRLTQMGLSYIPDVAVHHNVR